jgi:hypothetical protein
MSLERKTTQGSGASSDYQNLEEGDYDVRLVYVADLGLHQDTYKGEVKPATQKIALGLEVIGKTVTIDDEEKPRYMWTKPFNIFSSLTEKGNELKFYSVFEPSAKADDVPDWDAQLGKACSIYVEQNDKGYDNIVNVAPIPPKYQEEIAPATLEGGVGDDEEVISALYGLVKWTYDKQIKDEG